MSKLDDAVVVRELATLAASQGCAPNRLIQKALKVAEKMAGRPRDDAALAAHRRCSKRLRGGLHAGA